jgi:hypothetical protein
MADWYTLPEIFEALDPEFDLDPCTKQDDGTAACLGEDADRIDAELARPYENGTARVAGVSNFTTQ